LLPDEKTSLWGCYLNTETALHFSPAEEERKTQESMDRPSYISLEKLKTENDYWQYLLSHALLPHANALKHERMTENTR
jgi:hypothetical protein